MDKTHNEVQPHELKTGSGDEAVPTKWQGVMGVVGFFLISLDEEAVVCDSLFLSVWGFLP